MLVSRDSPLTAFLSAKLKSASVPKEDFEQKGKLRYHLTIKCGTSRTFDSLSAQNFNKCGIPVIQFRPQRQAFLTQSAKRPLEKAAAKVSNEPKVTDAAQSMKYRFATTAQTPLSCAASARERNRSPSSSYPRTRVRPATAQRCASRCVAGF